MIQWQLKPRSRIKLFKIVSPTFSVYIIVLCPEHASNDTVTGLNWIPGIEKMDTYRTPARFPVFEWVLYQEHTFTDQRQNTPNLRQTRFLPLMLTHTLYCFTCFYNTIYYIYYLFSRSKSPCTHVKISNFLYPNLCYKAIPRVIHIQSTCAWFVLCSVHVPQTQPTTQLTLTKPDVDKPLCVRVSIPCLRAPCVRALRARMPGTCMYMPCPCLRVRSVCACLPCLFSLHTVDVGILLRRDIPLVRVFKGAPMHWREHPADLVTVVVSFSGWSDPKPSVCPCPADIHMSRYLALFCFSVLHSVLRPQHDRPMMVM